MNSEQLKQVGDAIERFLDVVAAIGEGFGDTVDAVFLFFQRVWAMLVSGFGIAVAAVHDTVMSIAMATVNIDGLRKVLELQLGNHEERLAQRFDEMAKAGMNYSEVEDALQKVYPPTGYPPVNLGEDAEPPYNFQETGE